MGHVHRLALPGCVLASLLILLPTGCSQSKPSGETVAPAQNTSTSNAAAALEPAIPTDTAPPPQFDGARALQDTREVVAYGPRYVGSPGHKKTEQWIRKHLGADTAGGATVESDSFVGNTPFGAFPMSNYIVKFPGTKDGIIVVAGHYDTIYKRDDFVGANDAGSSTGLPAELAAELAKDTHGKPRDGYSVWIVLLDGEEAFRRWEGTDNDYGSRHLAEKWQADGTLKKIKAFLLVDMIGDADLNIEQDTNSTPWLEKLVYAAAEREGYQSHFFNRAVGMDDDHTPFVQRGVPSADLIDFDYGYNNAYWHTKDDTMDKLSAKSFDIVGSVVLEAIRLLDKQ
jgi:glutaminyl-peptide cyclotransferase